MNDKKIINLLKETLSVTEDAANSYVIFYDNFNTSWPANEIELAKEMLGTLALHCHLLIKWKSSLNEILSFSEPEKEGVLIQLELINFFSKEILLKIKDYV